MSARATEAGPLPRPYWRLWTSTAVDSVGDGAFVAVIPLLTAQLTTNPVWVSAVSAAAFLPWLVLSLPIGAIVDRHDRFALMWRCQLARALLVGIGTVLVATDRLTLPLLLVLAVGLGTGEFVFGNASQAALPSVVSGPLLNRANGYLGSVNTVGSSSPARRSAVCCSSGRGLGVPARRTWSRSYCPPHCCAHFRPRRPRPASIRRYARRSGSDCATWRHTAPCERWRRRSR